MGKSTVNPFIQVVVGVVVAAKLSVTMQTF